MQTIAQNLSELIKFNKDSFSEAIVSLITEVEATELYLQKNGTDDLKNVRKIMLRNFVIYKHVLISDRQRFCYRRRKPCTDVPEQDRQYHVAGFRKVRAAEQSDKCNIGFHL